MLAVLLAAATLALCVAVIAVGEHSVPVSRRGIAVIVMAIAAFLLSKGQRSRVVAALLGASGLLELGYGLIATDFLSALTFPGPVFGIIIGVPLLALAAELGRRTLA